MQNFQDTFETRKRSFISAFSICKTVPLITTMQVSRNSRSHVFYIKQKHSPGCALKKKMSFIIFQDQQEYLCWILSLIKTVFSPAVSLKIDSFTGTFLRNLENFEERFFKEYLRVSACEKNCSDKILPNLQESSSRNISCKFCEVLQKSFCRILTEAASKYRKNVKPKSEEK